MIAFSIWGRGLFPRVGCHSGLLGLEPLGRLCGTAPRGRQGKLQGHFGCAEWSRVHPPAISAPQIYRRCWLVFRKSSSSGPQRLEKYPGREVQVARGCPKVRGLGPSSPTCKQ